MSQAGSPPGARLLVLASITLVALSAGCAQLERTLGIPAGRGLWDALIIAAFALVIFMLYRRGSRRRPGSASRRSTRRGQRSEVLPPDEREGGQEGD